MIRSATITGRSAAPRTNATAARRRLRCSNGALGSGGGRGLRFADVGHRLSPHGHEALGGCDQFLVVVRRLGELGEHLAANEHDHAIADLQVVELVACEQQAGAGRCA